MNNYISVAVSVDDNYTPHLSAMLHSLFFHNKDVRFRIHFLKSEDISHLSVKKIEQLCKKNGAVFYGHSVCSIIGDTVNLPVSQRYPKEIWYRLLIPDVLKEEKKIIWLDADIIVQDSILPIWTTDLTNIPLAAVPSAPFPKWKAKLKKLGIKENQLYYNSGVLVMNLEYLRSNQHTEKFLNALNEYNDLLFFPDQDILNILYAKKIKSLDLKWNFIASTYFNIREALLLHGRQSLLSAIHNPKIVHFTSMKPWMYSSAHPYREAYLYHRKLAGCPEIRYLDKELYPMIQRYCPLKIRIMVSKLFRFRIRELVLAFIYL